MSACILHRRFSTMDDLLRYWPKDVPIPEGWELVSDLSGTHHGNYSVLIRKVEK